MRVVSLGSLRSETAPQGAAAAVAAGLDAAMSHPAAEQEDQLLLMPFGEKLKLPEAIKVIFIKINGMLLLLIFLFISFIVN